MQESLKYKIGDVVIKKFRSYEVVDICSVTEDVTLRPLEEVSTTFEDLEKRIIEWGYAKGIIQAGNKQKQVSKTLEEVNELLSAVIDNDLIEIIDAIGDSVVTLILQVEMNNLKLINCLECAYIAIKDRTGKIKNGSFIKD